MVQRKKKPPGHIAKTQGEVAQFFDVSVQAIQQWAQAGMPGGRGAYNLKEIAAWRQRRSERRGGHVSEGREDPELEYKRHRAELMWIRLERERGELVEKAAHEGAVLRLCGVFKAALLGSVPTIAAQCEGLDEQARAVLILTRAREILEAVALNASSAIREIQTLAKRRGRKASGARRKKGG